MIAAKGCTYSSDCSKTGLNNNRIIVGGSGSGKTMSITEPCLLHSYERNLIITATKARIVHKYRPVLLERGYRVEVLDFAQLSNCTVGYDPMRFVRTSEDVEFLARGLVMANPRKDKSHADPYWDDMGISVLSAFIEMERLQSAPHRCSFVNVVKRFRSLQIFYGASNIHTNLDTEFQLLELEHPGNAASAHWESFCHLPGKTASCVVSTLSTTIRYLFNQALLEMMQLPRCVDFSSFTREKKVLFLITSPVNQAMSNLVSVFYATAMKELFELAEQRPDGKLPIPTHMICDDFATGAPIPDFAKYISIIREKELSVTILCQSESQLESMYSPAESVTIINNCDTYVFTGGMDLKTAQGVSLRMNMPVDAVLALPMGQFVVFRRGQMPIRSQRYPILEDPVYLQLPTSPPEYVIVDEPYPGFSF
jgi:type IV secretory pathway TraG/TraD family ATPase VirD4